MFIRKKELTPYQIGERLMKMRATYLEYVAWFDQADTTQKRQFGNLCKKFNRLGRSKQTSMIELSQKIAQLCDQSDNAIQQFATTYEVNPFLGIRYVARMTFLRVFHEQKQFRPLIDFTGNAALYRYYAIQMDNLLHWTSFVQQRMSKIGEDKKDAIIQALNTFSQKIQEKDFVRQVGILKLQGDYKQIRKLYLEIVAPVLGDNVPVLIQAFDHNPNLQHKYVLYEGPHDMRLINLLCLQSLKEVLKGKKPILTDEQGIVLTYFGKD